MEGINMLAKITRLFKWLFTRNASRNFRKKAVEFEYVWIIIGGLWIFALLSSWPFLRVVAYIAIVLLALLFIIRPMNAVYGLMGTSGSVRLFFFNFLFITFLFACIYQGGFFKYAGISYDVNQPHVDYNYYAHKSLPDIVQSDTLVYKKKDWFSLEQRSSCSGNKTQLPTYYVLVYMEEFNNDNFNAGANRFLLCCFYI